jgi:hypothetical protein
MRKKKYEYKFVRLGEGAFGVKRTAKAHYQETVHQHARDGWRLVQIFSPGTGIYGASQFFELIFEREVGE